MQPGLRRPSARQLASRVVGWDGFQASLNAGLNDRRGEVTVRITSVGHAGFHIETKAGSILCDPWVNPAYFASWFPFPDNSHLDWDALGNIDYLYVSHLHKDHYDPQTLLAHVNKDAVVLLPDYPVPDLKRECILPVLPACRLSFAVQAGVR